MEFWGTVGIAAAIATALATGTSTAAALWWRRMDQAHADWAVLRGRSWWAKDRREGDPDGPNASATLANAGDGSAFRVSVTGKHCTAWLRERAEHGVDFGPMWTHVAFVPVATPGDTLELRVHCEAKDWDRAIVVIGWTGSPTWRKKRSRRTLELPLVEIASRPRGNGAP